MPNIYYRAKSRWEQGAPEEGFALLNDHLSSQLRREVFLYPEHLLKGESIEFDIAVSILLSGTMHMSAQTILRAPFCRVFVEMWKLDPSDQLIQCLRNYDFNVPPSEGLMDLGEQYAPPANDDADFAALGDALVTSAEVGLLTGEHTAAQSGRAVLTLDQIHAIADKPFAPWKTMLIDRLRAAYERAPKNPWPALVERDPLGVLERFLHHITGRGHSPSSASGDFWRVITREHPEYADAARTSLKRVLAGGKADVLDLLAQIDANRPAVSDGAAWVRALQAALDSGDFSQLP